MSKKIEQLTEKLVTDVISYEYELVDVEYVKENKEMYLRILIDKAGGMSIDDCEELSRIIGDKLDEDDFIDDSYYLEISSLNGNMVLLEIDGDLLEIDKKSIAKINLYIEF